MNEGRTLDAEAFARLAQAMFAVPKRDHTVDSVVRLAVDTVDGCDVAGIAVRVGQREVTTRAATDPIVNEADRLQYDLDEGPCLDAIRREEAYVANYLRDEPRWPRWAPKAADLGLGSILSVRLATPRGTFGALNLYSREAAAFDRHDVEVAHIFGAHAAVALSTSEELEGLRAALRSRHSIGLAQGILMERYGLSSDAAFDVLRRYSRDSNVKLRDVAANVVDTFDRSRAERATST
jgi:GAF domain-containing protein